MFPKMIPFSVEATLTLALILQKSWAAIVNGCGFSTSFKSPGKKGDSTQIIGFKKESLPFADGSDNGDCAAAKCLCVS